MRESYPATMGTFTQLNNALEELVAAIKADAERPQEPAVAALLAGVTMTKIAAVAPAPTDVPPAQAMQLASPPRGVREHLRRHWPEYLMEGGELGIFMISACIFGALL